MEKEEKGNTVQGSLFVEMACCGSLYMMDRKIYNKFDRLGHFHTHILGGVHGI